MMPWIGIECALDAWELRKWADLLERSGGKTAADLLERCAKVVGGEAAGVSAEDRMREIEARAAASVERIRADAAKMAGALVGKAMADGADMAAVMKAAGMDGWRNGSAGKDNAGIARRRKKFPNGRLAVGTDGGLVAAERGAPALTSSSTVNRDRQYGETWEGWAGSELRKAGLKMRHVAKGLGMAPEDAWRCISGFTKHWRREALAGRAFPGPKEGWADRLEAARALAMNIGVKGRRVVLNGSCDCGLGADEKEGGE